MEEQVKSKKPRIVTVVVLGALVLIGILVGWLLVNRGAAPAAPDEVTPDTPDTPVIEEQIAEPTEPVIVSQKGGKMDAYDFIVETLAAPQYWSKEEFFPEYSAPWYQEEAEVAMPNGTGWKLVDAQTATFQRGYHSVVTICFSDMTVKVDRTPGADLYIAESHLDFRNEYFYDAVYDDETGDVIEAQFTLKKDSPYYKESYVGILEDTFSYYDGLFTAAGCPLLGQPAGTLTGYKGKEITPVQYEDDGLIHCIWKQEGFSFNWEDNENVVWLDDYHDIENQKAPDSEPEERTININGTRIQTWEYRYSSNYLVLADPNSSRIYQARDGEIWFEQEWYYDNIVEALATYYLQPVVESAYGYNGVFFFDATKLPEGEAPNWGMTKAEFDAGISSDQNTTSQTILEVCNKGGDTFLMESYINDIQHICYDSLMRHMKQLCEYHNKPYPYADDYLNNFFLVYRLELQNYLGLR